jgi:hypothetical protein
LTTTATVVVSIGVLLAATRSALDGWRSARLSADVLFISCAADAEPRRMADTDDLRDFARRPSKPPSRQHDVDASPLLKGLASRK